MSDTIEITEVVETIEVTEETTDVVELVEVADTIEVLAEPDTVEIEEQTTAIVELVEAGPMGPEGPQGPPGETTTGSIAEHEAATTNVHGIANTASLIAEGDARLSDARAPTAHTHPTSEVTGLDAALADRATDAELAAEELARTTADDAHTADLAAETAERIAADNLKQDAATAATDAELSAHAALDTATNDAHGAKTYTDLEVAGEETARAAADAVLTTAAANAQALAEAVDADLASIYELLPEPSGGDDLATINAAITAVAAAGGVVKGRPGSTYLISGPIIVKSNVTLDMSGCTINFTTTSIKTNMLQNATVAPATTATDAATTAGSSVITSSTLAAAASVGQACAVVGAGPPGGDGGGACWLYGQVSAVNPGANTITLSGNVNGVRAHITASGQTAYLFNRDSEIEIIGGTWDSGANWVPQADRIAAGVNSHLLRLRRVDGFRVRDVLLKGNTFTGGLGWNFGIAPADCTDWVIENCRGDGACTVVQGDGPLARGIVRNIQGTTQDDMVAFGCVSFQGNDCEGDITDILVDGVQAGQLQSVYKAFAGTGSNGAQRICDTTARSVKGRVTALDYAGTGTVYLLVEDASGDGVAGQSTIINTAANGYVSRNPSGIWTPSDAGLLLSTFEPERASSTFQPAAGFIYLFWVKVPSTVRLTNLLIQVTTAGATLTSGQCLLGLYDAAGNLRAATATQHTAWQTTGLKTAALTAQGSYTLDTPGRNGLFYRIAVLANGTTRPVFAALPASPIGFAPALAAGNYSTVKLPAGYLEPGSRTSLPASIASVHLAQAGMTTMPWVGAT